MYIAVIYLQKL